MREELFDSTEIIDGLHELIHTDKIKRIHPKFNRDEMAILVKIILQKPKDFILFHIADYMAEHYQMGVPVFANGASMRRLQFFKSFIVNNGNATKAAIEVGYSPRSAKQQGHRTLRWIQSNQEKSISG